MGAEEGTPEAEGCTRVPVAAGRSEAEGSPSAGCTGTQPLFQWSRCETPALAAAECWCCRLKPWQASRLKRLHDQMAGSGPGTVVELVIRFNL